ncbi:hypothetical protein I7I51_02643 [Histoplasma capsulatum]|uniref:Uncharacterized protein n=1 Tax=Ajellomyces capsulatus TaxID=5037 RepID=A0A8A1MCH0_AJECA|nr:hypothetical protein I7I51_02643 [Histoplasma capsulatum]
MPSLAKQFQQRAATWTAVKRDAYTLQDSANGHSVRACCQAMVCNAKSGTSLMSSPSLLHADKLNAAKGKSFVSVVDEIKWFYQWQAHPEDHHKLTVITH